MRAGIFVRQIKNQMNLSVKYLRLILAVSLLILPRITFAQSNIKELLSLDDKTFWKGFQNIPMAGSSGKPYRNGQGVRAYYPSLPIPKKIALVSFYLFDIGTRESVSFGNYRAFGWSSTHTKSWNMTEEGAKKLANQFYAYWMETALESFKITGSTLITPDSFTPEQKAAYENFKLEKSKIGSAIMSQSEVNADVIEMADGYLPIIPFAPGDYKMAESIGLLAKELGVDAVLIAATEVRTDKQGSHLSSIGMYMYGPNPVPRKEDVKYFGFNGAGRQEGNVYEVCKVNFNKTDGVLFYGVDRKSGEVNYFDYEGIDQLYGKVLGGLWYQLVTVKKCGQSDDK